MTVTYLLAFLASLVMAYVLAHFVDYADAKTLAEGAQAGFWIWLGFFAPAMLGIILWEGKPVELYLIHAGFRLVELFAMAVILTLWV